MNFNSLELALAYLARHPTRYIFPIKSGAKFPPLIKDNLAQASNDPAQIEKWVKQFTRKGIGPNWGVALKKSNLFVADVDVKPGKGGQQTYDDLDLDYGWPETETVTSPSGGFHKYYSGEHIFALGKNGLGDGIDSPNYVIMAGCVFADGTSYRLTEDLPTAPKPSWFGDVIQNAKKERVANADVAVIEVDQPGQIAWAIDYLLKDAEPSIEGKNGDLTTFRVACSLKDNGISEAKAVELMDLYYNVPGSCDPEWDYDDLVAKIRNAYAYASLSQTGGKSAEAEFGDEDVSATAAAIPDEITGNPAKKKQQKEDREIEKAKDGDEPDAKERIWSKAEVVSDFVWVVGIERFVKISDTRIMWKKTAFESAFGYLAPKKKTFCESLLTATKGTVRRFHEITYQPGRPQFLGNGAQFNCYTQPTVVPAAGDTSWWNSHLEYLFPDAEERGHVLNWLAWLLQNISLKPKHALLIQGHVQGTGKSFIAEMLTAILHKGNVSPVSQTDLHGQFNGWALRSKLLLIEELRAVDRNEVKNKLHDLITQESISINEKNVPQHETVNCFGILAMTNDDAAISLDATDRRYLVVRTDAEPRPEAYYTELYARLNDPAAVAAVAYELMNRDLGQYDARGKAPLTVAKREMITAGQSDLEHFLVDAGGEYPLNGRVIQIKDVIDMLPKRLERAGRVHATVASILKKRYQAVEAGQFRLSNGMRARLYVINGSGVMKMEGWQDRIVGTYESDRAKGGISSADEDFGEEDFGS